jgi:hypothetical protein
MLPMTAHGKPIKTKGPQVFPESHCRPGKSQSATYIRGSLRKVKKSGILAVSRAIPKAR